MNRRTKILRNLVFLALAGCVALLLVQQTVLPGLVAGKVRGLLQGEKIPVESLEGRRVSLSGATFGHIALGPHREIVVDSLRVSYGLSGLRSGRVGRIELSGLQLQIPEAIEVLRGPKVTEVRPPPTRPPPKKKPPLEFPFEEVVLNRALLDCALGGKRVPLQFSGTARVDAQHHLHVDGKLNGAFFSARISGQVKGAKGEVSLELDEVEIRVAALAAHLGLPLPILPLEGPLRARISLRKGSPQRGPVRFEAALHQDLAIAVPDSALYTNRFALSSSGYYKIPNQALHVEGQASLVEPVFRYGDLFCAWDRFSVPFAYTVDDHGGIQQQARVELEGGVLEHRLGLQVENFSADFPLPLATNRTERGSLQFTGITYQENALGGLKVNLALSQQGLRSQLYPDVLGTNLVHAAASYSNGIFVAEVRLPPVSLQDTGLPALAEAQSGYTLAGTVGAKLRFEPGRDEPISARIQVEELSVAQGEIELQGIEGSVEMESLKPFRSRAHQEWKVARLSTPKATLENGLIRFTVEGHDRVFVEENQWSWAGGLLYSKPFTYRPSRREIRTELFCEGVQLQEVITLILGKQVQGTGELFGRVPLSLRWSPYGFNIGGGYLHAAPGTNLLEIKDQQVIDQVLQAVAQGGKGRDIKDRILVSLKQFEYSAFRIKFHEKQRGFPSGNIFIVGEGKGELGVPLVFNLRFSQNTDE